MELLVQAQASVVGVAQKAAHAVLPSVIVVNEQALRLASGDSATPMLQRKQGLVVRTINPIQALQHGLTRIRLVAIGVLRASDLLRFALAPNTELRLPMSARSLETVLPTARRAEPLSYALSTRELMPPSPRRRVLALALCAYEEWHTPMVTPMATSR